MTIPPPDAGDPYAPVDYPTNYPDSQPGYPPPPGYPRPSAAPGYQQQPYPGFYADPYNPYGSAAPVGTNGLATASLALSIGGALASLLCFLGAFFVIAGIIVGIVALNQIKRTHQGGRGLAIAGIAVGAVTLVIYAALIVLFVLLANGTIDYSLV